MLLKQIEYFVAIVEENNFTDAGLRFNVSQSAISQQLNSLEKELCVSLIKRDTKKFELTNAGEYFYNKGKKILAELENLKEQTIDIGKNNDLILNIGYLNSYLGKQLSEVLTIFAKIYPEVEVNVFSGTHEELYDKLKKGEVLVALNDQRRAFSDEYENQIVVNTFYCACLPKNHPFTKGDSIEISRLNNMSCILIAPLDEQTVEKKFFSDMFGEHFSFLFVNNLEEAKLLVNAGRGFLLSDSLYNLNDSNFTNIKLIKNGNELKKTYCMFWRKLKTNYYIEELAKLLISKF